MQHFNVPVIAGVIRDFNERVIPDNRASDCNNVTFEKGRFKTRWGYQQLGNTVYNPVMKIVDYEQLDSGNRFALAFTTTDAYRLNVNTGVWTLITKKYITGSIGSISGTTVNGSSTNWVAGLTDTDYEIKFGTQDLNATPGTFATGDGLDGEWFVVSTIDSATTMTLATAPGGSTTGNYVIRALTSGDEDDEISVAFPYDSATGVAEKIVVATNGIEVPRRWAGSGEFTNLGGSPNVANNVSYFGGVGSEHLIFADTVDTAVNYPQRIETSSAGTVETYAGQSYDLLQTNDKIKGILPLAGKMYVYKEESITEMWADPSGTNEDPFNFTENKIAKIGVPTIETVSNIGSFHIFLGSDNNIYVFDGSSAPVPVGDEVTNEIDSIIDRQFKGRSFSFAFQSEDLYLLFIPLASDGTGYPVKTYVFNYKEKTWTKWTMNDSITAIGGYNKQTTTPWNSATGPMAQAWSALTLRWTDLKKTESQDRVLLGDSAGKIYEFEKTHTMDDGTSIESQLITKDYPVNDPKHTIRILEFVLGFAKVLDSTSTAVSTGVTVEVSVDFGESWSTAVTITEAWTGLSADYRTNVYNFLERGKHVRFRITSDSGTPFDLESLLIGFNQMDGKVK